MLIILLVVVCLNSATPRAAALVASTPFPSSTPKTPILQPSIFSTPATRTAQLSTPNSPIFGAITT